ncbi:MAG: Mut7-C RNAse domain-containing protein, partial [Desulfobacterales bacterium]|nr:Mut7-C RNAse domain-containing protein [Desulfobacterales bacterium]
TRDPGLLKNRSITHGCLIKATNPLEQSREVIRRFDLYSQAKPFTRCMDCNGLVNPINKDTVLDRFQPGTIRHFDTFTACSACKKVLWKASHFQKMEETIERIMTRK